MLAVVIRMLDADGDDYPRGTLSLGPDGTVEAQPPGDTVLEHIRAAPIFAPDEHSADDDPEGFLRGLHLQYRSPYLRADEAADMAEDDLLAVAYEASLTVRDGGEGAAATFAVDPDFEAKHPRYPSGHPQAGRWRPTGTPATDPVAGLAWFFRDPAALAEVQRKAAQLSLRPLPVQPELSGMAAPGEPTAGKCYKHAALVAMLNPGTRLVHGVLHPEFGPRAGTTFAHAWVDLEDGRVFDPVTQKAYAKDAYYAAFRAEERESYTEHVGRALGLVGHWGPWMPEEQARMRAGSRRKGRP